MNKMTAHRRRPVGDHAPVLDRLAECPAEHFDVEHCTFQVEPARHRDHKGALHA